MAQQVRVTKTKAVLAAAKRRANGGGSGGGSLDARDPDIVRAKRLQRRGQGGTGR